MVRTGQIDATQKHWLRSLAKEVTCELSQSSSSISLNVTAINRLSLQDR
jgi:hypothetical protein